MPPLELELPEPPDMPPPCEEEPRSGLVLPEPPPVLPELPAELPDRPPPELEAPELPDIPPLDPELPPVLPEELEPLRPLDPALPEEPLSSSADKSSLPDAELPLDEPLRPLLPDSPSLCEVEPRSGFEPPDEPLMPLPLLPDEPEVFLSRSAMSDLLSMWTSAGAQLAESPRAAPKVPDVFA
jgi:hypothetical protein